MLLDEEEEEEEDKEKLDGLNKFEYVFLEYFCSFNKEDDVDGGVVENR